MGISIWQSIIARRSAEAAETAGRAAEVAARAAENQLPLQLGQLDIAREQMTSASKFGTAQLESQREAIRLDQRAWLGLSGYALQARTPNAREPAEWQLREPQMGDEFRFRFELTNNGRTPALNVATVVSSMQILLQGYPPPREPDWANAKFPETPKTTVFPNDSGRYHFAGNFRIDEKFPYTIYRSGKGTMFIWARTYYCDTSRRLHWHQVCVSHIFGTNSPGDFGICASEVSPEPGETGHPRCH
jgi:hypothetical protein